MLSRHWTQETEDALTSALEKHHTTYFPNSPSGSSLTAVCSCGGLNEFFWLETQDDPVHRHRAQVALSALAEMGLLEPVFRIGKAAREFREAQEKENLPSAEEITQPKTWAEKEVDYLRAASDPSYWHDKR